MKLVLLHGRSQQGKDPIELKKKWIEALQTGLAKSNIIWQPKDSDVIFPYYGDLLEQLKKTEGENVENVVEKGETQDEDDEILLELLVEIAQNAGVKPKDIQDANQELIVEKGLENHPLILKLLRAIDKKSFWSEKALAAFTHDVYCYLKYYGVRSKIDKFVKDHIPAEDCVWVGHSLGSVVSYNVLGQHTPKSIKKIITVGSPLGVKSIKRHLDAPLKMPGSVLNGWYNGFDKLDIVSLYPLEKPHFEINPAIVNNGNIDNFTSNKHGIEGYLSDKDVAINIYNSLMNN